MASGDAAGASDEDPNAVIGERVPAGDDRANWSFRRFADVIADTYRAMDPDVAQLITAPGVLPAVGDADGQPPVRR